MRPKNFDQFVADYKAVCEEYDGPCVRKLRGNLTSKILFIAPSPTEEDVTLNLPFADSCVAKAFHQLLAQETGYSTENDFLVMAGQPIAKRATKNNVAPFRDLVLKHADRFKLIIVMGGDNFKFYFGGGKKSAMNTLASGTLIYLPKLLKSVPVFVFPEITFIDPVFKNDENDWKLKIDQEKCVKWITSLCPKLTTAIEKLKV